MKHKGTVNEDPGFGKPAAGLTTEEAKQLANGKHVAYGKIPGAPLTMAIDIAKALEFLDSCTGSKPRVGYELGAKIPNDSSQPGEPAPPGFTAVDCSGFVRAAIRRSTTPKATTFPDGSVTQHDWVLAQGFEAGEVDDGDVKDGVMRIAFLSPANSDSGVGHVLLLYNARTIESHGGVGPDRRTWNTLAWRKKTTVFRLT